MPPGCLDVTVAATVDEGNGEMTKRSQNVWSIASPQAGTVFATADIAHRMGTAFDAPMPPVQLQQTFWTCFAGRKGRNERDDLGGSGPRVGHGGDKLSDVCHTRPTGSERGVHRGADVDRAHRGASTSAVNRLGVQVMCVRIGKGGRQICGERGLIDFDGQDGLGFQFLDEADELSVGMQGIGGTHPLLDRHVWEHLRGNRDLIGFLVDANLEEGFLALVGYKGEHMGRDLPICSGSPECVAI